MVLCRVYFVPLCFVHLDFRSHLPVNELSLTLAAIIILSPQYSILKRGWVEFARPLTLFTLGSKKILTCKDRWKAYTLLASIFTQNFLRLISCRYSPGRYRDFGGLQHSLRSLEKNAPWIRNVYIITNGKYSRFVL